MHRPYDDYEFFNERNPKPTGRGDDAVTVTEVADCGEESVVKLRAERSEFAEAVTWATRTVGTRVTLPALAGVLLEAGEGRLRCAATDLEVSTEISVPVKVEEPGRVLLPGKLLSQLVAKLPDAPVELAGGGDTIELTCDRALFRVRCMPVEDFPPLPEPAEDAPRGALHADAFQRVVTQVARAASTDEARPVLTGVQLTASGNRLVAVATDSYRLAVRRQAWDQDLEAEALVPARALQEAARGAGDEGGQIELVLEEGQASFSFADRRLTSRLIEGTFPEYGKLLPDDYETAVVVERAPLIEALQRVAVVAMGQANTPLRLIFESGEEEGTGGTVDLRAGNQEVGDAAEAMPAEVDGDGLEIAFNPSFLLAGLEATGTERIRIELRDGLKPAVLRPQPADEDEEAEDYTYLLMPMKVR